MQALRSFGWACHLPTSLREVLQAGLPAMLRTCPQRWRVATAGWVALQAGLPAMLRIALQAG